MFLFTNNIPAELLITIFSVNSSKRSHNTRHCRDPHVVTRLTSFIARTFIHSAPNVWLDLPNNIRTITSIGQFVLRWKNNTSSVYINFALFIFAMLPPSHYLLTRVYLSSSTSTVLVINTINLGEKSLEQKRLDEG